MKTLSALVLAFFALAVPVFAEDYAALDQRADQFDGWQERVDAS